MIQEAKTKPLSIGRLAQETGIHLETVRYYERRGLLSKPPRTTSGYRIFPTEAIRRLRFIKRAQDLGFSLREIRELLELRVSSGAESAEIRRRTEAKIVDIEGKVRTLNSMRKALQKLTLSCSGCVPISECPILESLDGEIP